MSARGVCPAGCLPGVCVPDTHPLNRSQTGVKHYLAATTLRTVKIKAGNRKLTFSDVTMFQSFEVHWVTG